MRCSYASDASAFLLGALPAERRAALLLHAEDCEPCREEVALVSSLTAAFVRSEPPAPVLDAVMRACARPFPARGPIRWRTVGAIIAIAAGLLLVLAYQSYATIAQARNESQAAAARSEVRSLGLLVQLRQDPAIRDNPSLVEALPDFPYGDGAIRDGVLHDPWGYAYVVEADGAEVRFYSRGANGRDEGGRGDDITF